MFCKLIILLFSSLSNMITASVSQWVGGSVGNWSLVGESMVGGSVVGGFNKTPSDAHKKPIHFTLTRNTLYLPTKSLRSAFTVQQTSVNGCQNNKTTNMVFKESLRNPILKIWQLHEAALLSSDLSESYFKFLKDNAWKRSYRTFN